MLKFHEFFCLVEQTFCWKFRIFFSTDMKDFQEFYAKYARKVSRKNKYKHYPNLLSYIYHFSPLQSKDKFYIKFKLFLFVFYFLNLTSNFKLDYKFHQVCPVCPTLFTDLNRTSINLTGLQWPENIRWEAFINTKNF